MHVHAGSNDILTAVNVGIERVQRSFSFQSSVPQGFSGYIVVFEVKNKVNQLVLDAVQYPRYHVGRYRLMRFYKDHATRHFHLVTCVG